jgi:hypothetical protein
MCEEMPPVKALNFLQTEVSAVVDHTDAEEAEDFRSLLTYLLIPSGSSTPAIRTKEPASDEEHVDSPPRKRSRSNTPDRSHDHDRPDHEGMWTDKLHEEEEDEHAHSHSMRAVSAFALKGIEDPLERIIRWEGSRDSEDTREQDGGGGGGGKLSGARFSQRNAVFESLLEFVAESEKQPVGSLLDIIDGDEGGL